MRSIWESVVRWLSEAEDDDQDRPGDWQGLSAASKRAAKDRLKRARAAVAAKGINTRGFDQARRDKMARVMQDPHAARLATQPPEEWETDLPGQTRAQGSPDVGPEELPKPVQDAPGTASGIGAGRIAAKNAEPTSVALGARARRFDPGVSGIKQRFGVSPDVFYGDAPARIDPETGKAKDLRGRNKKPPEEDIRNTEAEIEKLQKLLKNPKTDRHKEWLQQRLSDKEAELKALQTPPDRGEVTFEPFKDIHAAAIGKSTAPREPRAKPTAYDAGAWKDQGDAAALPRGGEIKQGQGGHSRLAAQGDVRQGTFLGQKFSPAGHTAASEEEWAQNPELAARRMGGKGGSRLSYGRADVGQRGRMTVPANPGRAPGRTFNPYTQRWETDAEERQSFADPDVRAKIAAKLAMRGADISNKRFGQERRPHAGRASAEPLGNVAPKDANTQKADARAAAIASKPLGVNIRRDDEPKSMPGGETPKYKPEVPGAGQSTGSTGGSGEGPVDRSKMKQMIAQRLAAMAKKKA